MNPSNSEREKNRALMPSVTAFVDDMRNAFGADQVVVTYARENGVERGKQKTRWQGEPRVRRDIDG